MEYFVMPENKDMLKEKIKKVTVICPKDTGVR